MNKEELLAEAEKRYPAGTTFLDHTKNKERTIVHPSFVYSSDYMDGEEAIYLKSTNLINAGGSNWAVYLYGEWAKILGETDYEIY